LAGSKSGRAFTLVELLVVMAIIALLAALLMPALSKAKNQAGKATDLNNLKQIMVAVHVYTSESSDVMPPANWDNGYGLGWLYNYDPSASGPAAYNPNGGLMWPLLHTPKVYVCPSDDLQMWHWSNHDQQTEQRRQQLSSYAMNGAVVGYMLMLATPVKLSAFQPGDCAFWETDETEPFYFNDGANYPPEGVSGRHQAGGIQGVFDGSANYVKLTDWYEQVTETNRNRLWCYPNTPDGRTY
jgi:prepilin-type N-terminal cleavage/methylation domain-containing protein